jgi:cobalamin biosynthesis Mg chelatase CobN
MRTKAPTPSIPLTLGGMQGAPLRQARSSARVFLLPLVLALLAVAAFPVVARAAGLPEYEVEEGATGIHRETVKPKSGEKETSPTKSESEKKAHASEAEESTGGTGPSEEEETESSKGATAGGNSEGGGKSGGESSKSGGNKSGGQKAEGSVAEGQKVANEGSQSGGTPQASESTSDSGGGGSSPVVPILIAVIVLAAISIGVVIYRQRKGGSGQDGRISSPNAS